MPAAAATRPFLRSRSSPMSRPMPRATARRRTGVIEPGVAAVVAAIESGGMTSAPAEAVAQLLDVPNVVATVPRIEREQLLERHARGMLGMDEAAGEVLGGHGAQQRNPALVQRLEQAERDVDRRRARVGEARPLGLVVGNDRRTVLGQGEAEPRGGVHVAVRDVVGDLAHGPAALAVRGLQLVLVQSGHGRPQPGRRRLDLVDPLGALRGRGGTLEREGPHGVTGIAGHRDSAEEVGFGEGGTRAPGPAAAYRATAARASPWKRSFLQSVRTSVGERLQSESRSAMLCGLRNRPIRPPAAPFSISTARLGSSIRSLPPATVARSRRPFQAAGRRGARRYQSGIRGDTMKSHWVRVTMAAVGGSLLVAGPAAALDAPVVVPMQSKPGSVRLMVHAGDSGAPLGFYIERMKKSEYDALGGWPTSPTGSWMSGTFTGTPSFNIQGTGDAYALAPSEAIEVELGQLFDETGVSATDLEELQPNTQYVIRVKTNGTGPFAPSGFTETIVVGSAPLAQNCTFTQGYWKNHTEAWPVTNLTLGTVNYTAAELL